MNFGEAAVEVEGCKELVEIEIKLRFYYNYEISLHPSSFPPRETRDSRARDVMTGFKSRSMMFRKLFFQYHRRRVICMNKFTCMTPMNPEHKPKLILSFARAQLYSASSFFLTSHCSLALWYLHKF